MLGSFFQGIGETRLVLELLAVDAITFTLTAPFLIGPYGIQGLIVAVIAASFASTIYGLGRARKRFAATVDLNAQLRIYAAMAVTALPAFLFVHFSPFGDLLNLILGATLFLFTYLTIAPIVRAVNVGDIENLALISDSIILVSPLLKPVLTYEAKLLSIFGQS